MMGAPQCGHTSGVLMTLTNKRTCGPRRCRRQSGCLIKALFKEALHMAPALKPLSFNVNLIGPVLIAFGDADHYLKQIVNQGGLLGD